MSCKLEKNSKGKITNVLDASNKPSTLFKQILNVPTLPLEQAIDTYKNVYSEQLKDKVRFQKSSVHSDVDLAIQINNGNPLTLAPNGKPSILYQSYKDLGYSDVEAERLTAQVYSDSFLDFFGDWLNNPQDASRVVDENGQPLVVYHGSGKQFSEFKKGNLKDKGIYFTDNLYFALDVFAVPSELMQREDEEFDAKVENEEVLPRDLKYAKLYSTFLNLRNPTIKDAIDAKVIDKNYESGKDGFIAKTTGDFGYKGGQFVAFNPNQIKSATENIGTFSTQSNDIRFSVGEEKTAGEINQELIDKLKQNGLSEDVFLMSTQEMDVKLKELNEKDVKNIPNGFVYNNQVFLNKDTANNSTLLHEYNHLFNSWLKENRKELYNKGIDLVKKEVEKENSDISDIISYVRTTQPDLKGEALEEEILTELTGRRGAELLNSKKKSGIIDWIREAFKEIGKMLGLLEATPEQVSKMTLKDFADASAVQVMKGENFVGKEGEINFNRWKGDNELVSSSEIQEVRTGQPIVAKVYHGTTNEFYEFDASVKGNIEGHLGKVNYFTSDYGDANANYLSEGADITGRIDRRAEEIESELEGEYGHSILTPDELDEVILNFNLDEDFAEDDVREIAKIIAERELKGTEEKVLELYVKLNNPVVLGNGATWFDALEIDEVYLEEATQEIAEEYDITEEEAKSDYEWEIRDRAVEKQGDSNKIVEALEEALDDNGYDSSLASDILGDNYYEAEVDLNKLEQDLRNAELYDNYDGKLASSQVIADFFKKLGFDGIILTDVAQRFRNMGLGDSTSHIHVFDEFNNQIKLADGSNITFGETSDIRFQKQQVTEPNLSFETPSGETTNSYQEALQKTEKGKIKLNIEDVNVGEVDSDTNLDTFEGTINHLVKSGGLTGRRYIDKNGEVVFETMGKSDTAKQFTANLVEEQTAKLLGQRNIKRLKNGDFILKDGLNKITINGEEFNKKDIDNLDFTQLTKKFDRDTALRIELMREYSKALQPTKTKKRLEDVAEFKTEDELVISIKSLLNKLGVKITSIEDYIKNNTLKNNDVAPEAQALMDIVNKVMAFKNGTITREDLIEETMHLIEASLDPTLTEGIRRNIDKTAEWKEFSEYYRGIYAKEYSGDKLDEMVRREILGKVMANAVTTNFALEQDATLTKQSIFSTIKDLLQQFFNRVDAFFKPEYVNKIEALNKDIYAKLMAGTLYSEMNLDQNYGTKFRLYSASNNITNDIVLMQKQAEKALDLLRTDKKTDSVNSSTTKAIKDALGTSSEKLKTAQDKEAKIELVSTFAKMVNIVQKQTSYLERALKKAEAGKHPFSAEEMAVYMNLVSQFDNNILPTISETIKKQKVQTHAEQVLVENIKKIQERINELKGKVGNNGFNANDYVVKLLSERLGLDEATEKFLQEQVGSTQSEANWFFMQFGNLSHSSNIFLNALGHVITKTDFDKRQGFMSDIKPFIEKLANLNWLKDLSKFAKGNYIQSAHDFEAIEKAELEKSYEVYYKVLEKSLNNPKISDEQKTENKRKLDNRVSLEEFSKIEVFDDLDNYSKIDFRNEMEIWEIEAYSLTPFYADEHIARREKLAQYSKETQEFEAERRKNYFRILQMAETVNGKSVFTADMKYEFERAKKHEVYIRNIFNIEGELKQGFTLVNESTEGATEIGKGLFVLFDKENASVEATVAFELNEISQTRVKESAEKNQTKAGFSQDFKDILSSLDSDEAYEFLTLNSYISYTQEYYDTFSGDNISKKLEEVKDGENDLAIQELIENIQSNTKKMNTIIQANKVMNNPSEVNYDFMEANEVKSVKEYAQELEYLYQEARQYLPKEEIVEQERVTEVTTNKAFLEYMLDTHSISILNYSEEGLIDAEATKNINKIFSEVENHTTESKKREIQGLKVDVERFSKGTLTKFNKLHSRVFSIVEDDLKTMTKEEIYTQLTNDLLKYSYSKLLPYFKKTQPVKADLVLKQLESGEITSAEFIEKFDDKGTFEYLQISPNYTFQEVTEDNNKNPHFQFAKENGTPAVRIFEKGVTEEELRTKSLEQLQNEGKVNKFIDKSYFEEYGIDLVTLFNTGKEIATKNKEKFEAREALIGLQKISLDKVGKLGTHNLYQLPQKEKSKTRKLEDFFSKGANLKSMLSEITQFREDDIELGTDNKIDKNQTLENLTIPIFGVRKLKDSPVTDDLLESYVWMNYKANEHKARKDNYQDAFNVGIAAFGDDFGYKTSSEAGNNYKMFKEAMDYNFYGIKEVWSQKLKLPLIGEVDMARVLQNFGKWIRLRNLGFTLISPITSATTGFTFKGMEKLIGENIDKDAEAVSNKFFRKHAGEASLEMLSLESKTVLNSLGELYGWYEPLERYSNTKYSKAIRGLGESAFAAHQLANFPVNTRVGLSVLANHRFFEGKLLEYREYKKLFQGKSDKEIRQTWRNQVSVLDVVQLQPNGEIKYDYAKIAESLNNNFTEAEAKEFIETKNSSIIRGRIKAAIQKIDGAISSEDRSMSTRNAFFSFVNIHRSWLFIAIQNKTKGRQFNTQTGYFEEGSWRSVGGYFMDLLKSAQKEGVIKALGDIRKNYDSYDEVTKRNINRTLYEFATLLLFSAFAGLAMKELDDSDEDSYLFKVSTLMLIRTTNELASSSTALHKNVIQTLDNVIVGLNSVETLTKSPDFFSSEIVSKGRYKGLTERERYVYKQLPLARDYNNLFLDIEGNIKSYNFHNFQRDGNLDATLYPFIVSE